MPITNKNPDISDPTFPARNTVVGPSAPPANDIAAGFIIFIPIPMIRAIMPVIIPKTDNFLFTDPPQY